MKKYSVLLVDDEEEVFEIIMKKLDWESMGFFIAGYAKNGVEALEMAEELQPDVVMTDIKMPYMDGLTLSRRIKELYENVKIIIFSGFDEFEYAKEAIKIEVEEYILKPIDSDELREVFERIRTNLDKELDEKRNIDKLRKYYMESLPILQENFYIALIEGRINTERIDKYLTDYQITFKGPLYVVSVLHISNKELPPDVEPYLMEVSVRRLADEQLKNPWDSRIFSYFGDIIIISQMSENEDMTSFTDEMDRFCKMAKRVCGAVVTAGIGYKCSRIEELSVSYQGAKNALSYRVMYGNGQAINIAEIYPQENNEDKWDDDSISYIFKIIKTGNSKELEDATSEIVDIFFGKGFSIQEYHVHIMRLIAEIYHFGNSNNLNMEEIFNKDEDAYLESLKLESPDALKDWFGDIFVKMQNMMMNKRISNTKSFVSKAIEEVKENYADQSLTVETVCRKLGVSTAYFSTVFKKETGTTFINYLTKYRMEQATELLLMQDEKTYIIAEKVGYSDPNYFSYVFKKQFGMSPSKYKAEMKNVD